MRPDAHPTIATADPGRRHLARLVGRLAQENRVLLGLMRSGWSLEEAERLLRAAGASGTVLPHAGRSARVALR